MKYRNDTGSDGGGTRLVEVRDKGPGLPGGTAVASRAVPGHPLPGPVIPSAAPQPLRGIPPAGSAQPAAGKPAAGGRGGLSAGPGTVRIRLLGRFTVERDGADVPLRAFGGRQAQQLLRLLALRRGALLPKEVIAEALWPARPPADPGGSIEVLVSRIRRALGDRSLIQTGPGGYALDGDGRCQVDTEAFLAAVGAGRGILATLPAGALAHFREALQLWRGEPLAEDTYAAWAQDDRRLLTLAFQEALEGAAAAALAAGDPAEAVSRAGQALTRDPLRESAATLLVQALAAAGDRAGALAAFDSFGRRLASETGLDPSPSAQAVRQRLIADRQQAAAAGPDDTLAARLEALPAGQRRLACLLAVLGRPAPPGLLADAAGEELRDVLDCLVALSRAGMARHGPQGCGLRDEALGRVIAATLDPAEKARAHELLARALQRADGDPAEVAAHLLGSGDREAAALTYAAAAQSCLAWLRDAEALRLAGAGLSLEPVGCARAALLEARAEAYQRHGRIADARAGLASALDTMDDAAGRSRVLAELAVLEARSVGLARGEQLVELAIGEAAGRPGALGQALAAGAIIDLPAGNLRRARRRFERAGQLLECSGDSQAAARQLYWQAMVSYMDGRLREAVTQLGHLADLPVTPAELLRFWSPAAARGHVLAFLGEAAAGLEEIGQALTCARSAGYRAIESECLWRRSEALAFSGRARQAIEAAQQAAVIAARIGHANCLASSLRGLGIAWEAAGRPDRAEAAFRRSLRAAAGNGFFAAWAAARLGACLARQGRPQDAAGHVQAALAGGTPLTRYEARWAHAELLAARGDDRRCRAAAAAVLRAAEDGGYLILVPRLRELAGSGPPGT